MNLLETAQWAASITGDAPIGRPSATTRPGGVASVTFRGSQAWYDVFDHPDLGRMILFLEGRDAPTGRILGTFNIRPQAADLTVMKLIPQVVNGLGALEFIAGYVPFDASGVHWKRYRSEQGDVRFTSYRKGTDTECEIAVGSRIVGLRIGAGGLVRDVEKLEASRF